MITTRTVEKVHLMINMEYKIYHFPFVISNFCFILMVVPFSLFPHSLNMCYL